MIWIDSSKPNHFNVPLRIKKMNDNNRKKLQYHNSGESAGDKMCNQCSISKDISEFIKNRNICKVCNNNRRKHKYQTDEEHRIKIIEQVTTFKHNKVIEKQKTEAKSLGIYIHLPFCESLCTFCGCHKRITKNHQVETPYIDSVLKEWDLYQPYLNQAIGIKELHLGGGTPTFFAPEALIRLTKGIFGQQQIDPNACELSFEAHPGSTSCEHLLALYEVGYRRVSFGIQDYDPQVQKAIHRVQSFDLVKRTHLQARALGFSINHDLVYGLPFQNLSGFTDTIEKTIALLPERIALYGYAHVPWVKGTGQRGYNEANLPQDAQKRALYEIAYEKLLNAWKEGRVR